jgi:hypothetical protein
MRLSVARLKKNALLRMHPHERSILLAASRIQNEVRFSVRGLHGAMAYQHDSSTVMKAQLSFELFQVRLLAGKLYEAWRLLDRFYFRKDRQNLRCLFHAYDSGRGRIVEQEFESIFDHKYLKVVRDKLAFHFEQHEIEMQLAQMSDELEILIGLPDWEEPGKEQIIHYYIEATLGHALLSKLNSSIEDKAYQKTMRRVDQSATIMVKFANLLIAWVLHKNGQDIWDGLAAAPSKVSEIPGEQSVYLPCFVEFSD